MLGSRALAVVLAFAPAAVPVSADVPPFEPDVRLTGAGLEGWRSIGRAHWSEHRGIVEGEGGRGPGLLVLDRRYQDVGVFAEFRCARECDGGILVRAVRTADGGMEGVLIPLGGGAAGMPATVMIDSTGAIAERTPLSFGGAGEQTADRPAADLVFEAPDTSVKQGKWNSLRLYFDADVLTIGWNGGPSIAGTGKADGFGNIALYVGAGAAVEFRNTAVADIAMRERWPDEVSASFEKQRLTDFFYGWSAAVGDLDRDGTADIVSGPFIYFGPDFRRFREFAETPHSREFLGLTVGTPANPATEYPEFFEQYVADFTGDGWPDILAVRHAPPYVRLFVNPQGERRRWDVYDVAGPVQAEKTAMADIDGDGAPELVFTAGGQLRSAAPDPSDATGPWKVTVISSEGVAAGGTHGLGVGDVTGDGNLEILTSFGWWERPRESSAPWEYHPQLFGRFERGVVGGAEIAVYDVNGDGLNDVVSSLNAHGYGLAWFEQKRSLAGDVAFARHDIMTGPDGPNAGNVLFSQPHGTKAADVNGDGLLDYIVGKRYFSHLESHVDPDPWGAPVLYWYEAARAPDAPGGAAFTPHLIDNHSGVGSALAASDLDGDGKIDVVTATRFGVAVYWNRM